MSRHGRHLPFYLAVALAALSCVSAFWVAPLLATIIAANVFFATYLSLSLKHLLKLPASLLRREAAGSDVPVWAIFLVTLCAVTAALAALFVMLNARDAPGGWALALSFCAVPLGWMTIHMMAGVHYAHLYWQEGSDGRPARGLDFPGTENPGGSDFIYFSFVIGMAAQTSDVAITSARMRRMNIVHAIVSFFFNTILVAAAVNAVVTLGS